MRRAPSQLLAAMLLFVAFAGTACGDDDDEPAAERTDTVRTEPRTATEPGTDAAEATDTGETDTGSSDRAGSGLPDTCEILSASEVREAAGRDVDPQEEKGKTVDGFSYRQCNWTAVGFEDSVAVRVVSGTKRYDTLRRDLAGAGAQISSVDGLGDAAFISSGFSGESAGGSRGSTIFVKDGGRTLSLALANASDEGPRDDLVALMETMLSRAR